jgi:hypothetical protein
VTKSPIAPIIVEIVSKKKRKRERLKMATKTHPCDFEPFKCPFDARYSEDCRYHCGLGVDEDEPEDYESNEN